MSVRACLCIVLVLCGLSARAAAQGAPPRVAVGAGIGLARPLHADFDFIAPAWDGDVRVALSDRLLFEAAVGDWRRVETDVLEDVPTTNPPGIIGRAESRTTRVQRSYQGNLLLTGADGRLRMSAGGGVGLVQHTRRSETRTDECSAGVTCGRFESTFSSATGSIQAAGGVEWRLSRRVAVSGQARFVVPMTDPGSGDLRFTAGLRVGMGGR